jgi:hypothetical protein
LSRGVEKQIGCLMVGRAGFMTISTAAEEIMQKTCGSRLDRVRRFTYTDSSLLG